MLRFLPSIKEFIATFYADKSSDCSGEKGSRKKKSTSPSPPAEPLCPPLLESGDYLLIFDLNIF